MLLKFLYTAFCAITMIYQVTPVRGGEVTSYNWENPNMKYYIIHNRYTPRFHPEVLVQDLVTRAINEYQLPGITLNLTFDGMLYTSRMQGKDGINTISFFPELYPAETYFYANLLTRKEFDMKLNSRIYKTPESLYMSILHEMGHVFGLNHPSNFEDSVMGKALVKNPDGTYVQEFKYFTLTKPDVIGLYKHEAMFRSVSPSDRMFLNRVLQSILSSYPISMGAQICDCLSGMSRNVYREARDDETYNTGSLGSYYESVSLI
jgi:hypothetical protein